MNEFAYHADQEEGEKDASGRGKDCARALRISGQLKNLRCLELQVLVGDNVWRRQRLWVTSSQGSRRIWTFFFFFKNLHFFSFFLRICTWCVDSRGTLESIWQTGDMFRSVFWNHLSGAVGQLERMTRWSLKVKGLFSLDVPRKTHPRL